MSKNIGVKFAIGATMQSTVASAFATVDAKVKSLKSNVKELNTVSAKAAALMTADSRLQDAKKQYAANPTEKQAKAVAAAERAYKSAERSAKKYNITTADAAKVHAKAEAAIKSTTAALERQEKFQANAAKRSELQGQMLGAVASFATVAVPVKLAIDFESAMADVKKVTNFDAPGWAKFNDDLLKLSTQIPLTAEELAQIAAAAGEAGIAEEELLGFVEDAAKMSVAFGISAEEAGSAMTGLRTNFKLNQEGVISLGDSFNQLGNNMDATAGEIIKFSTEAGRVGSQYGITGQQVGALGATMIAMKINTATAAKATSSLFLKLGNAQSAGKDAQAAFQRLGFSGKEMSKAFKEDAQGTLLTFLEAVKRSKDPMRELQAIMGEGFGDEIAGLVGGLDEYKKALGLVAQESEYSGSMNEEYAVRSETTANSITLMKNAAARLGIILGSTVLPGIAAVANISVKLLEPVAQLATKFPVVTKVVFGVATALVSLKLAAFAGAYAGTLISDGWLIAKGVFNALRPSVLMNTVALQKQRIATLWSASATKVKIAWEKAHAFALAMSNRQTAMATLGQVRHRVVTLATAAAQKIFNIAMMTSPLGVLKLAGAQKVLNLAMRANPIGVVITAITALVGWFYTAYEKTGTFTGALAVMWDQFKAVVPAMEVVEAAVVGLVTFVTDLWNGASLYDAGAKLMGTLWDGVVAMWDRVKEGWQTVKGWLGFGDDENIDINAVVETQTVAEPVTTAAEQSTVATQAAVAAAAPAARTAASQAAAAPSAAGASAAASTGRPAPAPAPRLNVPAPNVTLSPQISFPVTMNGVSSKDVGELLVKAIASHEPALVSFFAKLLERIVADQRRLAYD